MKLQFKNKELEKLLSCFKDLSAQYGKIHAKAVIKRIDNLKATPTLGELPPGARAHPLKGDRSGEYSVTTKLPYALIIIPIDDLECENILKVKSIEIINFENYHK